MEFLSLYDIASANSKCGGVGGRRRVNPDEIVLSIVKSGKNRDGKERTSLSVKISRELANKARYIFGDRLDILISSDGTTGLIKRVSAGGFAASSSGSKTSDIYIKMTWYEGMPRPDDKIYCKATLTDIGIEFKIK